MMFPFVPFPLIILSAGLYSNHGLLKPPHTHVHTDTHLMSCKLMTYPTLSSNVLGFLWQVYIL